MVITPLSGALFFLPFHNSNETYPDSVSATFAKLLNSTFFTLAVFSVFTAKKILMAVIKVLKTVFLIRSFRRIIPKFAVRSWEDFSFIESSNDN